MTSASMTITRMAKVCTFIDAAGVKEYEDQDVEIEGTVSGTLCRAEPDIGIMSDYCEDICFKGDDGEDYELDEKEEERAQEILCNSRYDDRD
jgi:hypothetical protein